jgi:hypothetical protein
MSLFRVSTAVRNIRTVHNDTWTDMCLKRPVVRTPSLLGILGLRKKRKRSVLDFDDLADEFGGDELALDFPRADLDAATSVSLRLYPEPYCSVVAGMPLACFETSILELFAHNGEYDAETDRIIESLTDEQVLEAINQRNASGIFLLPANFTSYLAGVRRDAGGRIVSAEATYIQWFGRMNMTAAKLRPAPGRVEPIDPRMLDWEGDKLAAMQNQTGYPQVRR